MRRIITGVNRTGQSTVISIEEISSHLVSDLWATSLVPPTLDDDNRQTGTGFVDVAVLPGRTRWLVSHMEPDSETPMHRTDTLDYDTVIEGAIELVLEDTRVPLHAGDCVLVAGVAHQWRTSTQGCSMSCVLIGLEPLEETSATYLFSV